MLTENLPVVQDNQDFLRSMQDAQALLKGHFLLSSGLHSDTYFQCAKYLQYPELGKSAAKAIAQAIQEQGIVCDMIVGPALGGMIISYLVADSLGVPGIFTERVNGEMTLRRGFHLEPGVRVVMVEDVITTGGSVMEAAKVVTALGAEVVGFASMINRSGQINPFTKPYVYLAEVEVKTYHPDECPLCQDPTVEKAYKPGSR
jgi:orotate phosphoribosyltransferase